MNYKLVPNIPIRFLMVVSLVFMESAPQTMAAQFQHSFNGQLQVTSGGGSGGSGGGWNPPPPPPPPAAGQAVYLLQEVMGQSESSYPVKLFVVFAKGSYFPGGVHPVVNGVDTPAQVNVSATWPQDGSIASAYFSWGMPVTANAQYTITFANGDKPVSGSFNPPSSVSDKLDYDFTLMSNGVTYTLNKSNTDSSNLFNTIKNTMVDTDSLTRVYGNVAREYFVKRAAPLDSSGNPHPTLMISYNVTLYSGVDLALVEYSVENARTDVPAAHVAVDNVTVNFDGVTYVNISGKTHYAQSVWRVFPRLGSVKAKLETQLPLQYLARIGILPPLDELNRVSETDGATLVNKKCNSDSERGHVDVVNWPTTGEPFDRGCVHKNMPITGDRIDIGFYPLWALEAMNGFSPSARAATYSSDINGSGVFPIHNWDPTFNFIGVKHGHPALKNSPVRISGNPNTPNTAHLPNLGVPTYLLTGSLSALDEFVNWSTYAAADKYPRGPMASDEIGERSHAWALRQWALSTVIVPDHHDLKSYFSATLLQGTADNYANAVLDHPLFIFSAKWKNSGRTDGPMVEYGSGWAETWFGLTNMAAFMITGQQSFWNMAAYNWNHSMLVANPGAPWSAPNGEIIDPLIDNLVDYSPPYSIYTPIINSKNQWDVLNGSVKGIMSVGEMSWYARLYEDYGKVGLGPVDYPTSHGPEPENWRPKLGYYTPATQSQWWEYSFRNCNDYTAAFLGLPDAAGVTAVLDPLRIPQANKAGRPKGVQCVPYQ